MRNVRVQRQNLDRADGGVAVILSAPDRKAFLAASSFKTDFDRSIRPGGRLPQAMTQAEQ